MILTMSYALRVKQGIISDVVTRLVITCIVIDGYLRLTIRCLGMGRLCIDRDSVQVQCRSLRVRVFRHDMDALSLFLSWRIREPNTSKITSRISYVKEFHIIIGSRKIFRDEIVDGKCLSFLIIITPLIAKGISIASLCQTKRTSIDTHVVLNLETHIEFLNMMSLYDGVSNQIIQAATLISWSFQVFQRIA